MSTRTTTIRLIVAGLIAAGACMQGLPRRVAGSDLTLPERGDRTAARSITSRCTEADTTTTRSDPTSRCGSTEGDSVRSTTDPMVPPVQKTP